MSLHGLTAVLCVTLAAVSQQDTAARSGAPPFHAAYTVVKLDDTSRNFPSDSREVTPRPLDVHIWYPTEETGTGSYEDYLLAAGDSSSHLSLVRARNRNLLRDIAGSDAAFDRLRQLPIAVRVNGAPAPGRFPVVVHALGLNDSPDEQAGTFAQLARAGFVVMTTNSLGPSALALDYRQESIETAVRDLELLLQHASTLTFVDSSRVAVSGFSYGGMVALLTAMRQPIVRGLFILDPAFMSSRFIEDVKSFAFFDPDRLRTPMFLAYSRDPVNTTSILEALRYSHRRVYELPRRYGHIDYTGYTRLRLAIAESPDAELTTRAALFEHLGACAVAFFSDLLRSTSQTPRCDLERLASAHHRTVAPQQPVPLARSELRGVFIRDTAAGRRALDQLREENPTAAALREPGLLSLGAELFNSGHPDAAFTVINAALSLYPASVDALLLKASALEEAERAAEAVPLYERALDLLNDVDPTEDVQRKRARVEEALKRLRKK